MSEANRIAREANDNVGNAIGDTNAQFQIARAFNCLECLAYKLKNESRPSRKAVKMHVRHK